MKYKDPKVIAGAVIAILLVWGIVGGVIANSIEYTCDIGFWELCWTWHKNLVGVMVEVFS